MFLMLFSTGKQTKFSKEQEDRLCRYVKYRSSIGSGVTRKEIPIIIKEILDQHEQDNNLDLTDEERIFANNRPCNSWVRRFICRQKDFHLRTSENLGHLRKQVSETQLRNWFIQLEKFLLEEHDIVAKDFLVSANGHRIFNLDETGFPLSATNDLKVIAEKDKKNVSIDCAEGKSQITVLSCISAKGEIQKPLVIFPGVRPKFNLKGVDPQKYNLSATPNGWISTESFFGWLSNLFFDEIKEKVEFPILVFMDRLSSHVNIAVSEFCRENKIILYCCPPHASHIMQPLDSAVYGPLKKSWSKSINELKRKMNQTVSRANFFPVFNQAWEEAVSNSHNIISGFGKAGLVPFDPNALDYSRLIDEKRSDEEFNDLKKVDIERSDEEFNNLKKVDIKLGIAMALKAFEGAISSEKRNLFSRRYEEGWDLKYDELYNCYKRIRNLFGSNPDFSQISLQPSSQSLNLVNLSADTLIDNQRDASTTGTTVVQLHTDAVHGSMNKEEDNQESKFMIFDDVPDEAVTFDESDVCQACLGDANKEDNQLWIGCDSCCRWFHRYCLPINFDMSSADIEAMNFNCPSCLNRTKKARTSMK